VETLRPPGTGTPQEQRAQAYYERRSARLLALRMHVARYLYRSGAAQPRVAVLDSIGPARAAGLWVPDMIDAAGGIALYAQPGGPSVEVSPASLRDDGMLVLAVPGLSLPEISVRAAALIQSPEWLCVQAVAGLHIWCADYAALFGAPDERLIQGVEMLIRMILPEALGANGTPPPEHLAKPFFAPSL
jgi:iron complex transport system substrate-binding protein